MNRTRPITAEDAQRLYAKLSPHLDVVKAGKHVMEDYGCYPPRRNRRNDLRDWPLHSWRGPGTAPLCVAWSANPKHRPTFAQFLQVYRLSITELSDA